MTAQKTSVLPVSLFNLMRQRLDQRLPVVPCTKATLVHLSHTLENLVLSRHIPAMIFTGFQESRYWRKETERYRALAQIAQQIYIFAGAPLPPESDATSLHITLRSDDPLRQEWFLAILSEPFAVILCGQDRQEHTTDEGTRLFDTVWSFDPQVVNEILDVLAEVIALYQPERLAQLQAARRQYPLSLSDPAVITEFTLQMIRFEETLQQRYREIEMALQQRQERLTERVLKRTAALTQANQHLQQEITERRQIEEELQRYRDHLEDLVIERTAHLRAANQQLQQEIAERKVAEAERERLLAAEREQRLLAETMQEVILALTSQTSHSAVLDEILRQAQRLVSHNTANITLLEQQMMRVAFWQGYDALNIEDFVANLTQPLADFPLEQAVIQSRQPLVIDNTEQQPGWVVQPKTAWIKSYLIVPICLQDRVLGLLRLGSDTFGQFSATDAQRLQALANAAAIALENARLYAETQQRLKEQTALRQASAIISSTLDLKTVLNYIVEQMGRAIDVTSAYISGYNLDFSWIVLAEYYGPEASAQEKSESDLGMTYSPPEDEPKYLDFLRAGQVEILHRGDPHLHPTEQSQLDKFGIQSVLIIPLRINGDLVAFADLWESRHRRDFTPAEISLVQAIAQEAVIAIEKARLYAETQQTLKEQTILREAAMLISSTLDLTTILAHIVEQMGRILDATSVFMAAYDAEATTLTVLAEYFGPEANSQESISDIGSTYPVSDFPTIIGALNSGQPVVIHLNDPDLSQNEWLHLQKFGGQTVLRIPLLVRGHFIAYASLWESRRRRDFTPGEIALVQAIAHQAAVAIEKAQLYEKIQKQARQLEQTLHSVRAGILVLDSNYQVKLTNAVGENYLTLLAGIKVGQVLTQLGNHPLTDLLVILPPGQSHEVTPLDMSYPIFHVYARPVVAGPAESEGWVLVMRDITEERDIQMRMQQQEKLAAVGQLAAGIAHDFNNILTSIIGFAELARYNPDVSPAIADDLRHIVQQGRRAAHLVRQILDFARKNIIARRPLDLAALLQEIVHLLERTIPENIAVDLQIEPNQRGYVINADATQLQQALTNLAVNAADAMPEGGTLSFGLSAFTLVSGQHAPCPEMRPGDWLALVVADTGVGMTPEVQKHLFEPFFTTKEVGRGTGLGLAQVAGIINQHEGCIRVESQVGQGATFTLFFLLLPPNQPAGIVSITDEDYRQGGGNDRLILLVEDNPAVLEVMEAMLKRLGYQVLTATNGRNAVEIYAQYQDKIALVVTDLTMPEMGGLALAEALYTKNPAVKILAMTGYPLNLETDSLTAHGIVAWLPKPLNFEKLTQQLEKILQPTR